MNLPAHSKIGASSMKRWAACPGSVKLSEGIESRSSVFAEEGTKAHELGEKWLLEGERAFAGYTVDMVENVAVYVDAVCDRVNSNPDSNKLLVEQRFHLHELHSDLFGTSDAIVWQPHIERLSVIDLKYGAGVPVEVEDNPQLQYYALGALLANKQWKPREVEVVIVQPRCPHPDGPVRAQVLQVVDLLDFAADLVEAVKRTEEASEEYARDELRLSGAWANSWLEAGDHCRFCSAAAICPEQRRKAQQLAKQAFAPGLPYDAQQLAETLEWLPVLEAWIKNTREFAYAEAEKGHDIPRHKLVEKRATRKWRDPADAWKKLKEVGVDYKDALEEPALKSPSTIEKLLPKDQRKILDDLCVKESSGHTLVHESDKREAIKVDAKSAFANQ